MFKKTFSLLAGVGLVALTSATSSFGAPVRVLADTQFLKDLGIEPVLSDSELRVSVAEVSEDQASWLSENAHHYGKCGGFERLLDVSEPSMSLEASLEWMRDQAAQARAFDLLATQSVEIQKSSQIENATRQVSEEHLRETVQWLSSYPTRFHKSPENNKHVEDLAAKIRTLLVSVSFPVQIDFIQHQQTPQKSLRVRLQGKDRPSEVVVLGAHLDSIVAMVPKAKAPGADDNASGSANLVEALRIVSAEGQPSRTIEFFWYAAEEIGLVGSAEIAQTYKKSGIDVVGVLQLDMTLFPGEGELVLGEMTDFTNPWLRKYLRDLSDTYVGVRWVQDQCGYGCSDHASWHRQGYATVMPFEARYDTMNKNIHTNKDLVTSELSFKHSAAFARLAVAFALDYANSQLRPTNEGLSFKR